MFNEIIADKENVLKMLEWVQAELHEECDKNTQCKNCSLVSICGDRTCCDIALDNLIWLMKKSEVK